MVSWELATWKYRWWMGWIDYTKALRREVMAPRLFLDGNRYELIYLGIEQSKPSHGQVEVLSNLVNLVEEQPRRC